MLIRIMYRRANQYTTAANNVGIFTKMEELENCFKQLYNLHYITIIENVLENSSTY